MLSGGSDHDPAFPAAPSARRLRLAASTRLLEGFAPAGRPDAGAQPGALRLAFPVEGSWRPMGVLVRQAGAEVGAEMYGADADDADRDAAAVQVTRILSFDVDGSGFPALAVVDSLLRARRAQRRPLDDPDPGRRGGGSLVTEHPSGAGPLREGGPCRARGDSR